MPALPATPGDMPAAFARAWASRDGAAIGALFAEDADFVNVVGLWWHDRAAIARAHDTALKSFFADTRLTPGAVRVRMLSEDHAVVRCRFRLIGQRAPDGSDAGPRRAILTFVCERTPEGWLALAAQNTDVVDGAETLAAGPAGLAPARYRDAP